ncbi:DUF3800 domain-containing protein [Bosea sp. LjRoot237]|uniref:DUF3800 domain-containing protein n=1 Tax=Bosea sp. LjRoot237 TaxID=3342292 RepID=UPI003ED06942
MRVYVDESIHDSGGFIVVAAVASAGPIQSIMDDALRASGFVPGRDEFKSSSKMLGNEKAQLLRDRIKSLLNTECKIAIAVCDVSERNSVMAYGGQLAAHIARNKSPGNGVVYFDGGMKRNALDLPLGWQTECDCDSRKVAGIQLADSAAHTVSIVILGAMGLFTKTVPMSNFDPTDDGEIAVAWELWASTRYALAGGEPVSGYDEEGWCDPLMKPFGLIVSDKCSAEVKSAVERRLSSVWVGCIH